MPGAQKSLRLPEETMKEIEEIAKETGRDFSAIVKDLLAEAIKMRRCPGIVFAEGTGAEGRE
jgi:predicted transcriptional regulator